MVNGSRKAAALWIALGLIVLTLVPYVQTFSHELIDFDDNWYIFNNEHVKEGLTWRGIAWAFTSFEVANWHPVTWWSWMLDAQIARWFGKPGDWPAIYHFTNVLLHVVNAVFLFALMRRMTGVESGRVWRSALVAALFAIHPLHVESVAWAAERKDLLSALFGFAATWFYITYAQRRRQGAERIDLHRGDSRRTVRGGARSPVIPYALMLLFFALSLMSKPMLVTLPFVLLLLDWWPLRRSDRIGLRIVEKIPLFVMAIISSIITMRAQASVGAIQQMEAIGLSQRIANAIVSYAMYVWKTIWPVELGVLYPHPGSWDGWIVAVSALTLVAMTALAAALRRERPALAVGWLIFLGTLVPVIGLVQVGNQAMADRYTYVPIIGVFMMIIWAIPSEVGAKLRKPLTAFAMLIIVLLTARTFIQASYWRNSLTLFERTLAVTDRNAIIHNHLGFAYRRVGRAEDAQEHYLDSLEIDERSAETHENLGNLLSERGEHAQAIQHLQRAIALRPHIAHTHHNLGVALIRANRLAEAEQSFRRAIELNDDYAAAHLQLARLLFTNQQIEQTIEHAKRSLAIDPRLADAHVIWGRCEFLKGNRGEAVKRFESALLIQPDHQQARQFRDALVAERRQ